MHIITCDSGTGIGAFSPRETRRWSLAWESMVYLVFFWLFNLGPVATIHVATDTARNYKLQRKAEANILTKWKYVC